VHEGVSAVLESLKGSDLDGAKKMLETIGGEVRTERERGSLLAATGIYSCIVKSKDGAMQSWDQGRLTRAAQSIRGSQMADEFDAGFAETLMSYTRLSMKTEGTTTE
jgi:hypothetical protein